MVIVIVIIIINIWFFMICWWYWVFWFRVDFRFQDGSCYLLFFFRLLVIFLLESVTFYFLQVLVESYLQSASFGHTVAVQCIQCFLCPSTVGASFLVSSRFVLYCHVVTVHYFLILVTCLCFFSSGWSWGLFTHLGGSDVFPESGLVRYSSVPATLIAVPVLER